MVDLIINQLKKGSIKDVVLFSDTDKPPQPPYVIVKSENGIVPNTRQYRISVYHNQGMFDALQNYVMNEIDLLLPHQLEDKDGRRYLLYKNGQTDISLEPTDNTYFMERIFFSPLLGK